MVVHAPILVKNIGCPALLLGDDFAFHDWYFDRGIKVHWNLRI